MARQIDNRLKVKSVQRASTTVTSGSTGTTPITIAKVVPKNTILIPLCYSGYAQGGGTVACAGKITSPTQITVTYNEWWFWSISGSVNIAFLVIEFENVKSLQLVEVDVYASGAYNVTISAVDLDKAFYIPFFSFAPNSYQEGIEIDGLTSPTNFRLTVAPDGPLSDTVALKVAVVEGL